MAVRHYESLPEVHERDIECAMIAHGVVHSIYRAANLRTN
jgi:hypothetical protein